MKNDLGKGTKYSPKDPLSDGLTDREGFELGMKLRNDTGDKTQRPVSKTENVSGDDGRGSFKSKC